MFLGFGCVEETFDLLPPPEPTSTGGTATGGLGTGGDAGGETSGRGGGAGAGRGGSGGGPTQGPNCPPGVFPCVFCRTPGDCEFGTFCDTFRSYCAPFCDSQFDCVTPQTPICDVGRAVCVECTFASHCADRELTCVRGECVERECFSNAQCGDEVCDVNGGFCRGCVNDRECDLGMSCFMYSCVPSAAPMPAPPG